MLSSRSHSISKHVLIVSMTRFRNRVRSAVVVVVSALLMVVAAEIATRWVDGYKLFALFLLRISPPPTINEDLVTDYVNRLTVPADVDRRWFANDPDESSGGSTSPDPELVAYAAQSHGYGPAATFEWNLEYLRKSACETGPRHDLVVGSIFPAGTVFVFDPFNHSRILDSDFCGMRAIRPVS